MVHLPVPSSICCLGQQRKQYHDQEATRSLQNGGVLQLGKRSRQLTSQQVSPLESSGHHRIHCKYSQHAKPPWLTAVRPSTSLLGERKLWRQQVMNGNFQWEGCLTVKAVKPPSDCTVPTSHWCFIDHGYRTRSQECSTAPALLLINPIRYLTSHARMHVAKGASVNKAHQTKPLGLTLQCCK